MTLSSEGQGGEGGERERRGEIGRKKERVGEEEREGGRRRDRNEELLFNSRACISITGQIHNTMYTAV